MLPLRLRTLRPGSTLHRIHRLIHEPIFFGPAGTQPEQRYDDPNGAYKMLYLARDLATAFGETLVRIPSVSDVLTTDVAVRARSEVVTTRTLRLYPLLDEGVSAHGLSFTELHGGDYRLSWSISAEIHVGTNADGILYASRFTNKQCVALFDRAAAAVAIGEVTRAPLTPELAAALAGRFGKTLVTP